MTPSPSSSPAIPPLLMAWAEAWSSGDPAQLAAPYTENGVYEEIPTGVVAQGPEEIERSRLIRTPPSRTCRLRRGPDSRPRIGL